MSVRKVPASNCTRDWKPPLRVRGIEGNRYKCGRPAMPIHPSSIATSTTYYDGPLNISFERPTINSRSSISDGIREGPAPSRSARYRIPSQPTRGASSLYIATGAFRCPVHATRSSFCRPRPAAPVRRPRRDDRVSRGPTGRTVPARVRSAPDAGRPCRAPRPAQCSSLVFQVWNHDTLIVHEIPRRTRFPPQFPCVPINLPLGVRVRVHRPITGEGVSAHA